MRQIVTIENVAFIEDLEYGFKNIEASSVTAYLQWEEWRIPFTIKADTHKNTLALLLKDEAKSKDSIDWRWRERASAYTINYNVHLKEGLRWAEEALDTIHLKGSMNYNTLTNYASLLLLNNNDAKANEIIEQLLPIAGVNFSPFYGNKLLELDYPEASLKIWNYIAKNAPEKAWVYEYGYAKAYSALGKYKQALQHLKKAEQFIPPDYNQKLFQEQLKKLQHNEDINN